MARHEVLFTLASDRDTEFHHDVCALVTKKITASTPARVLNSSQLPHLDGLPLADDEYHLPAKIDVLLGADVCGFLFLENHIGPSGFPPTIRTPFGWVLMGSVEQHAQPTESVARTMHIRTSDDIHEALRKFWDLENVPSARILSDLEMQCEKHFMETHYRDSKGRYVVRLPFINEPVGEIGVPRTVAVKLFLNAERRRDRNCILRDKYIDFMNEYIKLGHMEVVNPSSNESKRISYLPHHGVWKTYGEDRKLRVVFNGSCAVFDRGSLNDLLLPGPKLHNNLWAVLTRWRFFRFAFSADITKMFRQIRVNRADCDWQRIVWRSDHTEEIVDYRLLTVTYGTTSAPYLANRVIKQLAFDERHNFPLGAEALLNNTYVDDIFVGGENIQEAEETKAQLVEILTAGGFPLDKWFLNYDSSTLDTNENNKLVEVYDTTGVLGLLWDPTRDMLSIRHSEHTKIDQSATYTKRTILSAVARHYDPMGWFAPVLLRAKIIIQDLWLSGSDWDEPVPSDIEDKWNAFSNHLDQLESIQVPRWIGSTPRNEIELHGFCDASERAYAASVYIRVSNSQTNSDVHLLICKTKVAPTKPHSIPRLELCGALLLARLMTSIKENIFSNNISLTMWTDASVVLAWIKGHASRWKPFVAHRVAEIQNLIPDVCWRHVRTCDNPADLATRGISCEDLRRSSLWWHGPSWLKYPLEQWPNSPETILHEIPDQRLTVMHMIVVSDEPNYLLKRFSTYMKLLRVSAFMLRFLHNIRKNAIRRKGFLTTEEVQRSCLLLCRLSQRDTYKTDIEKLQQGKPISPTSSLISLRPFLDKHGVLRVGGRLAHAPMTYDQRHPIIIDRRSPMASLLIQSVHARTLHGGLDLTRCTLMQQFWIPRGRNLIKKLLKNCVRCARFRGICGEQQMGNLPTVRLQPIKAFSRCGVDYAGPVFLRQAKGRGQKTTKGYLAVFVCLASKAVHLEVVSDMTVSAFIAAFQRLVARRGKCIQLLSDNGTTFRGADQELKRRFKAASTFHKEISELLANDGTDWKFIPPYAPHFGGLWEAAVKSAKTHLKKTVGDHILTYEELSTILCRIESCLNSRPLCSISDDPNDLDPLTPAHLAIGTSLSAVPEPYDSNLNVTPTERWHLITHIRDKFWARWSKEYISQLQNLPKWRKRAANFKEGFLVLIKNEFTPPTKWPLGRITEVIRGADGLVRVAKIRTKTGHSVRPITKLVLLPVDDYNSHNS